MNTMLKQMWRKHRNKGAVVIIFAIMLTLLWPIQTGIELDSTNIPLAQKTLKSALAAAVKSAAMQMDQNQLHQGNFVIDPTQAESAFGEIMGDNLQVDPHTWMPEAGSSVESPMNVKLYLYNQWKPSSLPGQNSSQLNVGTLNTNASDFPTIQDVQIQVTRPTILAVASWNYTTFWGKKVTIEEYASAQVDYASNGSPTTFQPQIDSISESGSPYHPVFTITGHGFGGFTTPFTGNIPILTFMDSTRNWAQGCSGCGVTDNITSWSDTEIDVSPSGSYNTNAAFVYMPGDAVHVSLENPQTQNTTAADTVVHYPVSASINAGTPTTPFQSWQNGTPMYLVTIPFNYTSYEAGSYTIDVVDSHNNTVDSPSVSLNVSGASQVSWTTTFAGANDSWHLDMKDSQGRVIASSNTVTGYPQAPIDFNVSLSGTAQYQSNNVSFTASANHPVSGSGYQVYLDIYNETTGQWVTSTGSGSQASATVNVPSTQKFIAYITTQDKNTGNIVSESNELTVIPGYWTNTQVQTGTTTQQQWQQTGGGYYTNQQYISGYTSQTVWGQTGGGYWTTETVQTGTQQVCTTTKVATNHATYYSGYWVSGWVNGSCTKSGCCTTGFSGNPPGCGYWVAGYYGPPYYNTYQDVTTCTDQPVYGTQSVYVQPTYGWVTQSVPVYSTRQVWIAPTYGWVNVQVPVYTTETVWTAPQIN